MACADEMILGGVPPMRDDPSMNFPLTQNMPQIKEEQLDLPMSQNTLNVLHEDLGFDSLENIIMVSQGLSQRSVGDIQASIAVSAFEQTKISKSSPWVFSPILNRLFVKNAERIPLLITCHGKFHEDMFIIFYLKFSDVQFHGFVVEICPNHLKQNHESMILNPKHMLQYQGDSRAVYVEPPDSNDFCVRIPIRPEAFEQGQSETVVFSCLSSCVMVARRNLSLHAELSFHNHILSKVEVPLKISASPMRDMMNLEAKQQKPNNRHSIGEPALKRTKRTDDSQSTPQSEIVVRVKGRKFTEDLKHWLSANVSSDHYVIYAAQEQ